MTTIQEIKKEFEDKFLGLELEFYQEDWVAKRLPKWKNVDVTERVWQFIEKVYKLGEENERKRIKKHFDTIIVGNEDAIMVAVKAYRAINNKPK